MRRTEAEVQHDIAANTSLLADILRLVPEVDPDTVVPCSLNEQVRCPLLYTWQPQNVAQALQDVRAQVRRVQYAIGRAQLLGAHLNDIEEALGDVHPAGMPKQRDSAGS